MRTSALGTAFVCASVASDASLASGNLLPRRVGLHFAAIVAMGLLRRPGPTRLGRWWVALLAGIGCGWMASPLRHLCADGALDALATLGLTWAIAASAQPRRRLLGIIVGVAGVGAVVGVVEQWLPLSLNEATRPASLFASRSTAGAFVASSVLLLPVLFRRRSRASMAVAALASAFVLGTRARAAWLGSLVGFARLRPAPRLALGMALGVAAGLLMTPGPRLGWKSSSPYGDSVASLSHALGDDRVQLWAPSLRLVIAHPVFGFGPGAFEAAFAPVAPTHLTNAGVRVEAPHNEALRVLVEWGAAGVLLLGVAFFLARPRGRASERTRALQASLTCLGVTALAGKTLLDPPTLLLAAVVTGLLLRRRGPRRAPAWPSWLAACALAGLVCVSDVQAVEDSRALARAHDAASRGLVRQAWEEAEGAAHRSTDVRWWLWAVALLCDAGDSRRCHDTLDEAKARFPGHPMLDAAPAR